MDSQVSVKEEFCFRKVKYNILLEVFKVAQQWHESESLGGASFITKFRFKFPITRSSKNNELLRN